MPNRKPVSYIETASLSIVKTKPPGLQIDIEASYSSGGWSNPRLSFVVYTHPPADGIYEAALDADSPTGIVTQAIVSFKHSEVWDNFPEEHLKGVRIKTSGNLIEALL